MVCSVFGRQVKICSKSQAIPRCEQDEAVRGIIEE